MKKLFTLSLLSAGLILAASSCNSNDNEKYFEMKSNAADAPVTVLETPEGFRFDMDKDSWNIAVNQHKYWLIGDKHYTGYVYKEDFIEGKICSYEIWIRGRENNSNVSLTSNDIDYIVKSYKSKLKGFEHALHQEDYLPFDTHLWTKGNLVVEITSVH